MTILLALLAVQEPPMPQPGPHHKHLEAFAGTWTYEAKFTMGPDQTMESKGVQTDVIGGGGLWLVMDVKGDDGMWGHGMVGYDESKQKYVGVWVDSMTDYFQLSEGECSDDGKTLTTRGKVKDMMDPSTWVEMRSVSQIVDADHKKLTFYMPGEDGKEMEAGVIEYTRKK